MGGGERSEGKTAPATKLFFLVLVVPVVMVHLPQVLLFREEGQEKERHGWRRRWSCSWGKLTAEVLVKGDDRVVVDIFGFWILGLLWFSIPISSLFCFIPYLHSIYVAYQAVFFTTWIEKFSLKKNFKFNFLLCIIFTILSYRVIFQLKFSTKF